MALGADDEEPSRLEHLLAGALDLGFDGRQALGVLLVVARLARSQPELRELEARHVLGIAAELDVDTASGHVRRDHHGPGPAGVGDDLAFALGVLGLGVQHLVLDAALAQALAQQLGVFDRDRADEHRLAGAVALDDLALHSRPLAVLGLVNLIVAVRADHRLVRRDLDDRQLVDLHELGCLGERRAGHAGELRVEAEVVLQGDRRERLVLVLNRHALLGLDRLVQALGPAPAVEHATGELVDDLDLAINHGVVDVALVQRLRTQGLDQVVDEVPVLGPVEVVDPEEALGLGDAKLGHRDRLVLLLDLVVEVGDELLAHPWVEPIGHLARRHLRRQARELHVHLGRALGRTGDDQGRARFVDQDVVDLVDDCKGVTRDVAAFGVDATAVLNLFLEAAGHVVAQIVKAELRVGAVGHVAGVGVALVLYGLV